MSVWILWFSSENKVKYLVRKNEATGMGRAGIVVGLDLLISQIMRKKERKRSEVRKTI